MAGREVREYTNLTDPKDKKWGKGKEKIDDEDTTFQRMVAKVSVWPHFLFLFLSEQFAFLYTIIILDFIIVDLFHLYKLNYMILLHNKNI
ncbi:hypothetical protein CFP56_037047 [Quercus suber]|uniref:Uncharacterized protein n=1 Tax=Quercus suber TaxID=58331 RepID=A0AAW0J685_QUESU